MVHYCWYNTENKQFSRSWVEGEWMQDVEELKRNHSREHVLIKYEIITDHPDFRIDETMGELHD